MVPVTDPLRETPMTLLPARPVLYRLRARHVALAAVLAVVAPVGVAVVGPSTTAAARPTPVRSSDVKVQPARRRPP